MASEFLETEAKRQSIMARAKQDGAGKYLGDIYPRHAKADTTGGMVRIVMKFERGQYEYYVTSGGDDGRDYDPEPGSFGHMP